MKNILTGLLLAFMISFYVQAEDRFENVTINGQDVNGMTVSEATEMLNDTCLPQIYIKTESAAENLRAEEIGVLYTEDMVTEVYSQKQTYAVIHPVYDEEKLETAIHSLKFVQESTFPESAKYEYDETAGQFTICKEVEGTAIDESLLAKEIQKGLEKGWIFGVSIDGCLLVPERIISKELSKGWQLWLSADACRLMPEITEADLKDELSAVNQMLQTEITLSDTVQQLIINKDTLLQKGMIGKDGCIDEEAVSAFVDTYNFKTEGLARTITSPATGTFIQDGGVFYSKIDKEKETARLISEIKEGMQEKRYPEYEISMDNNSGIGNTFIEVSIDNQKVYLIRDGEIEYTADCVTGCVNTAHDTPKGVCFINSKHRSITLAKYNAYVNYWMAFIGTTYGLHDASWRNTFGGDIYINDGSHGCVNMFNDDVAYLYEHTDIGIPLIVH